MEDNKKSSSTPKKKSTIKKYLKTGAKVAAGVAALKFANKTREIYNQSMEPEKYLSPSDKKIYRKLKNKLTRIEKMNAHAYARTREGVNHPEAKKNCNSNDCKKYMELIEKSWQTSALSEDERQKVFYRDSLSWYNPIKYLYGKLYW